MIGLVLAKRLALNGVDVTVYESKKSVSENTAKASGIFSREGLSRIGVDFGNALVNTMDGAVINAGGETLAVKTNETQAFILDRGIFAELCAKEAKKAGAKLVLNKRFSKDEVIALAADKENIVVGADGAVSIVASAMGFPSIDEHILTYKAEYDDVIMDDIHRVELFFNSRIASRFFGWTVPYTQSKMEVGIGISDRSKKNSVAAFNEFINTDRMKTMLYGAEKKAGYASMIPLSYRKKTVIGNVLLVGDAAGQVKATTGGGIIFGASCAAIAAEVITEHIRRGTPLREYEKRWRKRHITDLRLHRLFHSAYSHLGDTRARYAFKALKAMGLEEFLALYGDMDSPSLMLKRFVTRKKADSSH